MSDFPDFTGPTIPANRLPPDCPLPVDVPLAVATAAIKRAMRIGMAIGAALTVVAGWLLGALT